MDFALTEEQTAIFDMARDFGAEKIAPFARQWEKDEAIPRAVLEEAASLGLAGIYVRDDVGGSGLSRLDATLIFEALAMACPSVGSFISIHNMCAWMIDSFASEEMRQEWLPKLCAMEKIASYCLTEPGSGSDAAALRTRAERSNEGYALNGTKAFISGGSFSDVYLTMVRTGDDGPKGVSAVLVEDGTPGLSFGALEDKMGWRSQPTSQVQFDDCRIPAENLVGEEGRGFSYAMAGLDGGRLNIAASALGAAQSALDKALAYMGERKAFGKSIDQFQALQFRLADMETELQASRIFLRQAAWKLDNKTPDATKYCAMAKRFVTDAAFKVANDALQLHGGYGYLADYGVEKIVRDLRVHQILEGTNEIMRVIIARALLAERGMSDILIRVEGRAGRITLNRPKALNALTYDMLMAIETALDGWAGDDAVALVVIDAAGDKAFAAGGDIVDLYNSGRAGDFGFGRKFWADEYRVNAKIANYSKPYIALMHGFVMGGGVGVSCHGSHRVVDESAQVAMPECGIGLTPDVGGSLILGHAPGRCGEYLAMTSARMGPGDAIHAGFADTYLPRARWEEMIAALVETGDPGVLSRFAETPPEGNLRGLQGNLDAIFGTPDAMACVAALEADGSDWALGAAKAVRRNCPLSVACAFEGVRRAREMRRVEDALALEYRFVFRCMEEGEFLEGIRAAVIDKDRDPHWATARLEDVTPEMVAAMLAPLGDAELKL